MKDEHVYRTLSGSCFCAREIAEAEALTPANPIKSWNPSPNSLFSVTRNEENIRVVVKMMVPFRILTIIRHLII